MRLRRSSWSARTPCALMSATSWLNWTYEIGHRRRSWPFNAIWFRSAKYSRTCAMNDPKMSVYSRITHVVMVMIALMISVTVAQAQAPLPTWQPYDGTLVDGHITVDANPEGPIPAHCPLPVFKTRYFIGMSQAHPAEPWREVMG